MWREREDGKVKERLSEKQKERERKKERERERKSGRRRERERTKNVGIGWLNGKNPLFSQGIYRKSSEGENFALL